MEHDAAGRVIEARPGAAEALPGLTAGFSLIPAPGKAFRLFEQPVDRR